MKSTFKNFLLIFVIIICHDLAYSKDFQKSLTTAEKKSGIMPYKLLELTRWDERYEINRQRDLDYLLDNLSGPSLNGLTNFQKKQVTRLIKKSILKQLIIDSKIFKDNLVKKYFEFFTPDELAILTSYYRTDLMQTIIKANFEGKKISKEELIELIKSSSNEDRRVIDSYEQSYISTRFARFQEKVNPIINKMIVQRMKELFDWAIKELPSFVNAVKSVNDENQLKQ